MKQNYLFLSVMLSSVLLNTSCSKDNELDSIQDNKWQELIGGTADKEQNWITAIKVKLNIEADAGSTISAFTINGETPIILGQKEMKGNGVMTIDVPQGVGESFGLQYSNGTTKEYRRVYLTGKKTQIEDIKFTSAKAQARSLAATQSRAASHDAALDGTSFFGNNGYSSFGGWVWESLSTALPEAKNVKDNEYIIHDYELTSDGPIFISYLYGYTGNYGNRTLGYYYHSKGTYDDIVYVDIAEALKYDYIDGLAKVQYQLDNNTNVWYDANFDYRDGDGLPTGAVKTTQKSRQDDDAYNTLLVYKAYGERISAMRGLTFKVDVPVGKEYGFYLKLEETKLSDEQKENMIKEGVPENLLPEKETNFSHMAFNTITSNGQHRSAMRSFGNFTFMGLDDSGIGGDMDCNDVTFGLLDQYGNPLGGEKKTWQSWTICFEDMGTEQDFDFNDVVIQVTPNTFNHTAEVKLLAKGGTIKTELYYGNEKLCTIHEAMKVSPATMVNTLENEATTAPVIIKTDLNWPEENTMTSNSDLFKIKATKPDGSSVEITTNSYLENGEPQAVCIAGDWAWPKELTNISKAYPMIGEWGKNVKDQNYWNWYSSPVKEQIVTPYSE